MATRRFNGDYFFVIVKMQPHLTFGNIALFKIIIGGFYGGGIGRTVQTAQNDR